MDHRHKSLIYHSRTHLLVTAMFVALPFVFLLLFSRIAHIGTIDLFTDVLVSTARLVVAYIIAAALAWIAAVSFYRGKRSQVALPLFDVLQSFPTFALLPLATLFFGPTNTTVIFFLVLTIIWLPLLERSHQMMDG